MIRAWLLVLLCAFALPAYADPMDEISEAIFEDSLQSGKVEIKHDLRRCSRNDNCTAVMSLCRWRPVNTMSAQQVANVSAKVQPECKWPPPPPNAPQVVCVEGLCQIPPDGKYY